MVGWRQLAVVISRAFIFLLLHNHIINKTKKIFLRRCKLRSKFSLFFLLHKRAKPLLPPYLLPHSPRELKPYTPPLSSRSPTRANSARTQTLYSPLTFSLYQPIRPYLTHCPHTHLSGHPPNQFNDTMNISTKRRRVEDV